MNLKIWIDLTNSPHVNFFKPFIKKWTNDGHEIVITARNLSNTIDLINQNNWTYKELGVHGGKGILAKIIRFPQRVLYLFFYLKKNKPDIAISHSSFESPLTSWLLRIPSIYLNDNEHAKANYIAFKFASVIILPEFLKEIAYNNQWLSKYKIEFYEGIKEGIYLSKKIFRKRKTGADKIFIRLEPWTAQYYEGNSIYLQSLISYLILKHEVIILPRSDDQINYFNDQDFKQLKVCNSPLKLEEIVSQCKLFIGAGGSMTRELAFLGVPTISVYQGELLEVDKYLIKKKIMSHNSSPDINQIEQLLTKSNSDIDLDLFNKGKSAFDYIDKKIKTLNKSILDNS